MKRYLTLVNLILVAGIAYFGVHAGYRLAALPLADGVSPVAPPPPAPAEAAVGRPLGAYQVVVDRNLFHTGGQTPLRAAALDLENLAPTALKLTLRGTVSGGAGQAYAVIEDDERQRQQLYRQGDEVQGAEIRKILRERVVLRRNGADEVLSMKAPETAAAETAAVKPEAGEPAAPVESLGKVSLSAADLQAAAGDLNNLAQQATIRPYFVEGRRDGFLLARVQPRSLFSRLGLRSGDVIKQVDGQAVTSVGQAMNLYQRLTPGREVEVLITREGADRTLHYAVD